MTVNLLSDNSIPVQIVAQPKYRVTVLTSEDRMICDPDQMRSTIESVFLYGLTQHCFVSMAVFGDVEVLRFCLSQVRDCDAVLIDAHGYAKSITCSEDERSCYKISDINPADFAYLAQHHIPIYSLACNTGTDIFAQELANRSGCTVFAPTDELSVLGTVVVPEEDGSFGMRSFQDRGIGKQVLHRFRPGDNPSPLSPENLFNANPYIQELVACKLAAVRSMAGQGISGAQRLMGALSLDGFGPLIPFSAEDAFIYYMMIEGPNVKNEAIANIHMTGRIAQQKGDSAKANQCLHFVSQLGDWKPRSENLMDWDMQRME